MRKNIVKNLNYLIFYGGVCTVVWVKKPTFIFFFWGDLNRVDLDLSIDTQVLMSDSNDDFPQKRKKKNIHEKLTIT